MPELPEVHTVKTDIERFVRNSAIRDIGIEKGYNVQPSNPFFLANLSGTKVIDIERIAKNIVLKTDKGHFLRIHLAMTGRILLRKVDSKKDKWQRIYLTLEKNDKRIQLRFCDMRMFGKIELLEKSQYEELKEKYGPEPIDPNLTPEEFLKLLRSKNTNVKNILLNQNVISGLGNVYAIDALWIAGIHPETRTSTLDIDHARKLLEASREILNAGIKNRGLTIDSFVDAFGKPGRQQDFFRVYNRENCRTCNSKVEFMKLNGRGTYFCPICQVKDNKKRLL